jgi:hypothetical protein
MNTTVIGLAIVTLTALQGWATILFRAAHVEVSGIAS